MMLNLIKSICEANDFDVIEFECGLEIYTSFVAIPKEGNKNQEYFLLVTSDVLNDELIEHLLINDAETMLESLQNSSFADESLTKNCTMILCSPVGSVSDHSLLKFEENPYHFIKNVISYSPTELISLNEVLSGDFCNAHLNLLMGTDSGQTFEKFKSGTIEEGSYFPLLIRVITKLPFVHYIPQSNQLDNIERFVNDALDAQDIHLLDLICSRELTQESMDSLINGEWLNHE